MNSFVYIINESNHGKTIRDILLSFSLGKSKIYQCDLNKQIYLDGLNVDQNTVVRANQKLEIEIKEQINSAPILERLEVIYEDDYFLIVNKPRDMLVHSDGSDEITLFNAVASYYKNHYIRRNIRVCNRLDYETCGLVIFAKDPISEAAMNQLIRDRKVEKRYYALCYNRFSNKEGQIDLLIGRDRHHPQKMRISSTGKEAITKYKVIKNGKISLVEIDLVTGRTHQIRVHMAYINHPLLGDKLYGKEDGNILCLQATSLFFIHPFTNNQVLIKISMDNRIEGLLKENVTR